ncbi:MAG: hypothetical protein ABSD38_31570 [Syntrophorhabdales bacterium]|jgi:hypothetical protein
MVEPELAFAVGVHPVRRSEDECFSPSLKSIEALSRGTDTPQTIPIASEYLITHHVVLPDIKITEIGKKWGVMLFLVEG